MIGIYDNFTNSNGLVSEEIFTGNQASNNGYLGTYDLAGICHTDELNIIWLSNGDITGIHDIIFG
jgi:hypothetical protein